MDWTAVLRPLAGFLTDESGGETVEYALTSVVAASAAAAAHSVVNAKVSAFVDASLELKPPTRH